MKPYSIYSGERNRFIDKAREYLEQGNKYLVIETDYPMILKEIVTTNDYKEGVSEVVKNCEHSWGREVSFYLINLETQMVEYEGYVYRGGRSYLEIKHEDHWLFKPRPHWM